MTTTLSESSVMSRKKTKATRGKVTAVAPVEQQGQPPPNNWLEIASGNKKHPLSAAVQKLLDSKNTPESRARATVDDFYKEDSESYVHDIDCLVEDADAESDPVFDTKPVEKPLAKVVQLKPVEKPLAKVVQLKLRKPPVSDLKN